MGIKESELKMGEQLVLDLADEWHPQRFRDEFAEKVQALIEAKQKAGDVKKVAELLGDEVMPASADVIDLTELLKRSLKGGAAPARAAVPPAPAPKPAPTKARTRAANDERERAAAAAKAPSQVKTSVKATRRRSGG